MSGEKEGLRRKIESAGDLNGVVRAMKALAASNIGQYERAVESLGHYYRTVELAMAACFRRAGSAPVPAKKGRREGLLVGVVIFGSDQGLVGQFNESLVDFAMQEINSLHVEARKIWAVGERIQALLDGTGFAKAAPLSVPNSVYGITPLVGRILIEVEAARERSEVEEVYFFHNRPKSGALFEPVRRRMLPLDQIWRNSLANLPWPTKVLPEVIEGAQPVLPAFVRGYLFVLLFQACAESLASENASRLASMQRAEKNIGEMLEELSLRFNRDRQCAIDEELFDVISGYEATSNGR
jgi:F-type H+-transporting ATPase subunit gamma